jgi:hypothetical protein
VGLYPAGWRVRYGPEIEALIDDDPPGVSGLLSLVRGAAAAHLQPGRWRTLLAPEDRLRLSLWAAFACWVALSVAGASFQKETEEPAFPAAGRSHWLLAAAHDVVLAGALLGAGAIALGGLPLLWHAACDAASRRDRPLLAALALPAAGLGQFVLVTAALLALAPANLSTERLPVQLAILVPWWVSGALFAVSCALAPRLALRRARIPLRALRRASLAAPLLVAAMVLVTGGLLAYDAALARLGPSLFAQSGGPVWPSTGAVLALGAAVAAAATALAAIASARALIAARTAGANG